MLFFDNGKYPTVGTLDCRIIHLLACSKPLSVKKKFSKLEK